MARSMALSVALVNDGAAGEVMGARVRPHHRLVSSAEATAASSATDSASPIVFSSPCGRWPSTVRPGGGSGWKEDGGGASSDDRASSRHTSGTAGGSRSSLSLVRCCTSSALGEHTLLHSAPRSANGSARC